MKLAHLFTAGCMAVCMAAPSSFAQTAPATAPIPAPVQHLRSRMFIYNLRDASSKLVFTADTIWEAPSWSPDGKYLISNSDGGIYRLTLKPNGTAVPEKLAIPAEYKCNNDKAISPDGKMLGFSASLAPAKGSNVFLANADGTNIKQMTTLTPSYFHGWSPDNKTMAFVAQRNGSKQFDIYRMPSAGGDEQQLVADTHHDDGPDYSPDGKWIYINSDRSGHEAIWRFPADGAGPNDAKAEMVLADGAEDWFPHISPDGKQLVYIAYPADTPNHNPRTVHVELKLSTVSHDTVAKDAKLLTGFTGGQGSLNVNSWAPDSERFAYVSYEIIP
jgi:TolB protein